jgi:predicted dehydrogenase
MHPQRINRREFALGVTAAAGLAPSSKAAQTQKPVSANDRIRMGFIGVGDMGTGDLADMLRTDQIDVVAIADPYEPNLDAALTKTNLRAKGHKDFRYVLDNKDIDAVCIATPDHWHSIPMIMACQAGKDVYVEKPLSHTIHEGRRMVQAAEQHSRVVQVGTQQRSGSHFQDAVGLVRSGSLGKIMRVDTWINWNRPVEGLGNPPDTEPPAWLDWNMWLGPAPYHAYNRNRCISNFRWFWDYSNGMIADWGVHLIDVVHWAMGVDAPRTVAFAGGKWVQSDNTETPDTFDILYEYPPSPVSAKEFIVTFESRYVNPHHDSGHSHGIEFVGTEGTLLLDRGGYQLWPEPTRVGSETVPRNGPIQYGSSAQHYPHVLNFLECVRTRQKPNSDIATMHRSTTAPLLGVVAFKTGRKLAWDAQTEMFVNDEEANRLLTKEYRQPWSIA